MKSPYRKMFSTAVLLSMACLPWPAAAADNRAPVDWLFSREPPGGDPALVPQLVSITFDDNFGLFDDRSVGGVPDILRFYAERTNPPGAGDPANFDGLPIRTTFFNTSIYMAPPSEALVGGTTGQDWSGRNLQAWRDAYAAGHEIADHTVNHFNGGELEHGTGECCRIRNWDGQAWTAEIDGSRAMQARPGATGAATADIVGFRAPYLSSNDALFDALGLLGFKYDSSLSTCLDDSDDGLTCGWPYTLAGGTPGQRSIRSHPGLWEVPPTGLGIPPDDLAGRYGFEPGLRERMTARGADRRIVGMDYSLLIDSGATGDEMRAILEYNLDQHLAGNRAPLILVAHSHLYAYSSPKQNPDTPSLAERDARWKGLTDFINYALTKPEVRVVAARDVVAWMNAAVAKNGVASR